MAFGPQMSGTTSNLSRDNSTAGHGTGQSAPFRGGPSCPAARVAVPKASDVLDLARRVRRLVPDHRDPERFHLDKSEIAGELHRLALTLERGRP
jgi:hypothetical protein